MSLAFVFILPQWKSTSICDIIFLVQIFEEVLHERQIFL